MSHKLFLILFMLTCNIYVFAQQGRLVQGTITDTNHNALSGATIKLYINGTKDTLNTFSEKGGSFIFSRVVSPQFVITVSSMGYEPYVGKYNFAETETNIRLPEITLLPFVKTLQEVVVGAPPVIIKEDTIDYKADSFKVRPDAVLEDLLKKLPGIQVNKNGVVTAQGKQVTKIKVNGKDFFGGDVKAATRELPANIIDRIQVIDDYGDMAAISGIKTGEPDKVINLQLKKDKNHGVFGKAETGYGTSDSYRGSLSANFFGDRSQFSFFGNSNNINNDQISTNSRNANSGMMGLMGGESMMGGGGQSNGNNATGNINIQAGGNGKPEGLTTSYSAGANYHIDFGKRNSFYGSYNLLQRNTEGFRDLYQQIFYPTTNYTNNQHYDYNNRGSTHMAYLNLDIYPDSFSYVKISPAFYYGNNTNRNTTDFIYFRDSTFKTREGYTRDITRNRTPNFSINILYNRRFRKSGRNLSVSLNQDVSNSSSKSSRPSFTRIFEISGAYYDDLQNQLVNQEDKNNDYGFYLAYTEPIAKDKFIDLTYFHNFSKSANDRKTFLHDPLSGFDSLWSNLSNQFTSRFTNERLGLNFRQVKKNYNYTLGISIMPVNLNNSSVDKDTLFSPQRQVNFSPLARFTSKFSRTQSLGIAYNGNNKRPNYLQLQPVRDISNPQFQKEGNPGLKPEFSHSVSLSFSNFSIESGSTVFMGMNFNIVQNKIVNNSILLDNSGAQLSRPENVNGFYNVSGFYSSNKPFLENKFIFALNGSVNYYHDIMLVNDKKVNGNNWLLSQEFLFTYNNNKWLELSAGANFALSSSRNVLNQPNQFNFTTWTFSHEMRMELPGMLVLKYDLEYTLNNGLTNLFNKNLVFLNIILEKKILKKRAVYLTFSGHNIFDQNSSFNRQVTGNSIIDIRSLQLQRYFLFTFSYRWNKFHSKE